MGTQFLGSSGGSVQDGERRSSTRPEQSWRRIHRKDELRTFPRQGMKQCGLGDRPFYFSCE